MGEPTSLRPVRGHKGHLSISIEIGGRGCHTGFPAKGINAIERAMPVLRQLDAQLAGAAGPFFGGGAPGVGDVGLWATVDTIVAIAPQALDDGETSRLRDWYRAFAALPGIDEYLANRPQLGARSLGSRGSLMFEGR